MGSGFWVLGCKVVAARLRQDVLPCAAPPGLAIVK